MIAYEHLLKKKKFEIVKDGKLRELWNLIFFHFTKVSKYLKAFCFYLEVKSVTVPKDELRNIIILKVIVYCKLYRWISQSVDSKMISFYFKISDSGRDITISYSNTNREKDK